MMLARHLNQQTLQQYQQTIPYRFQQQTPKAYLVLHQLQTPTKQTAINAVQIHIDTIIAPTLHLHWNLNPHLRLLQNTIPLSTHLSQQPHLSRHCSLLSLPFTFPGLLFHLPQAPQLPHHCFVPKSQSWEKR